MVSRKQFRSPSRQEDKKGKTGFELSRGQLLLRVMRSAGTTLQQPSCDKQHREKTRKVGYRIIVCRGDWLGNPAKIKDENKCCRLCWKLPDRAQSFVFCSQIIAE